MDRLKYLTEQPPAATDAGLLVLRVITASVFIVYGWWGVFDVGIAQFEENFQAVGIPLPALTAPYLGYVELIGGFLLLFGLLSRLASAGLVVCMAGALIYVHDGEPLRMQDDGSGQGFALMMGTAALALLLLGPGRASLDHLLAGRSASADAEAGTSSVSTRSSAQPVEQTA